MGVMHITRNAESPGDSERATNHANGTPKMHEIMAAMIDVCSEINSASLVDFCDSMSPKSDHGTRTKIDSSGSATNITATSAMTCKAGETRRDFTALEIRTSIAEML
jgi:hypothetical protein